MQNIIAAVFAVESEGYQAMTQLSHLPMSDKAVISQMVLVKKTEEGLRICDRYDSGVNTADDMVIGGLVGSLVGVLGGPIGVLLMGSYGMLVGSIFDSDDTMSEELLLEEVGKKLVDGEIALIALADETDETYFDTMLTGFQVEIARFDAAAVADEVEEAIKMEKEMARLARLELRKNKKKEYKERLDQMMGRVDAGINGAKEKLSQAEKNVQESAEEHAGSLDARAEQKLESMGEKLDSLDARAEQKLDHVDEKLDNIDAQAERKLESMGEKLDNLDARTEQKLENWGKQLDSLDDRLAKKLDDLDEKKKAIKEEYSEMKEKYDIRME